MSFVLAKNNPFATECLHDVPFRFPDHRWDEPLARLAALQFRATIVGRRGSGKSTLLRQLSERLTAIGRRAEYFSFPLPRHQHAGLLETALDRSHNGTVLLVDGVERLSYRHRRQLLRESKNGCGLLLAQHREGRLPTWIRLRTSVTLLHYVLTELGMNQSETFSAGERALATHRGNLRDALRELYDLYAAGRLTVIAAPLSQRE